MGGGSGMKEIPCTHPWKYAPTIPLFKEAKVQLEPKAVSPRGWALQSDEWFEALGALSHLVLKDERKH